MEQPVDPRYWTSLEELAGTARLQAPGSKLQAPRSEPGHPAAPLVRAAGRAWSLEPGANSSDARAFLASLPGVDRRSFLKLLGVSLAAGALSGCRRPAEKIIPYLNQPVEITPSVANWYATTCHGCSAACGALAKVVDGRPIKFEGNPDHGISRGGLCAAGQGAVLSLYDAYRQKGPAIRGKAATWEEVDGEVRKALDAVRSPGARQKVVLLTGTLTGPASGALIHEFLAAFPGAEHVVYDAVSYDAIREAHQSAYGRPVIPGYRFDRAEVIVSFGADFLGTWLSPVEFTKQYASGRDLSPRPGYPAAPLVRAAGGPGAGCREAKMSRHFQFESRMSLTGSNADERIAIAPSEQAAAVAALVARVAKTAPGTFPPLPPEAERALDRAAEALSGARGRSLVVCDSPDPAVQRAVVALNDLLGNVGKTVDLGRPSQQKQGRAADMARLVAEMGRGEVAVLLIHGCNPAYTYPEADAFATALRSVPLSVSFALTPDETARLTTVHCPTHHPLESWGDAEPQLGRLSLIQPTIRPLYETRAFEESLLTWSGRNLRFYDYLRQYWRKEIFPRQEQQKEFTAFWDGMLQRGFLELPVQTAAPGSWLLAPGRDAKSQEPGARSASAASLEVEVYEPVALRDGAGANNPWLQELPDPITKVTWDNYAAISPRLAREKGIEEGQWIGVSVHGHSLEIPVHIQPGQHPRTISIALGYGRTAAGPVGDRVGVNAYPLAAGTTAGLECVIAVRADRPLYRFGRTQIHTSLEGRPIVREISYAEHRAGHEESAHSGGEERADLWHGQERPDVRWGMAIDLTRCVGCSACVVACDIENNVPVVGREEVGRQREMHWLRIDRYYTGDSEEPRVVHQPMMCQQCGNASCEVVCPVLATVHDDQGLNVQVYNRCVGTRYCANNCPYKARRFNFFDNIKGDPTQNLALNPDVTVRSRGIMEKCTFCVQRIQAAKSAARREGRPLGDGDVRTACEQSCPADAIVFGNLADPESRVSQIAAARRGYRVLEELNRQPAVVYLARVRNSDEQSG